MADADPSTDIDATARARLRAIRQSLGWSLDDLAERANVGPSTISRIETGNRALSLDVLMPLARALGIGVDVLVAPDDDEDVVIRPSPSTHGDLTIWPLSRPDGSTTAFKFRLEPHDPAEGLPELQARAHVHPGYDWMFVIEGRVLLMLGERRIVVETGEAAEFSTMTPHAMVAIEKPAETVMIFDRHGERAHLHTA
ncbi:MAG: helix-turn-helix transcriptional regulator [Acidimicrobiia bacterium]|nr:helix-turn-helix transcriptional regulator [Acidimicrobiia bacterium]